MTTDSRIRSRAIPDYLERMSRSIVFVTDVPPVRHSFSGFSSRVFHFLRALAEQCAVELVVLRRDREDVPVGDELAVRAVRHVDLPPSPLDAQGARGRLRRLRHHLTADLPLGCKPARVDELDAVIARRSPLAVVFYLPHLAHLALRVPASIPAICVLEEGWERQWSYLTHLTGLKRRMVVLSESRRYASLYRRLGDRASAVVAISELEQEWFARFIPSSKIAVVPHSVDCEYFSPAPEVVPDLDVGVFGDLSHPRNSEGAVSVFESAAPTRELSWAFVGNRSEEVRERLSGPRALVPGFVPDIRPYYARARVVLAPTVGGTGVKTTVLEAWAMGRPVVATSFAVRGLPARDGDNVLIGESPAELIAHVRALLSSEEVADRLGSAGRATVEAERDIRRSSAQFAVGCGDVLRLRAEPGGPGVSAA
jgi:glycosyltransferase involved in cell wall biosynthesis